MPHVRRPKPKRAHPQHVTIRFVDGIPSLRNADAFACILAVFRAARGRFGMRIVEFSVLSNHIPRHELATHMAAPHGLAHARPARIRRSTTDRPSATRTRERAQAAVTNTSRGVVPRAGPMTPRSSIASTIFAARL